MKEKFSKEQIEEMLANSTEEIVEGTSDVIDEFGNVHNIDLVIEQAETDVKKKYPKINFRWSEFEIARAKKLLKNWDCHTKLTLNHYLNNASNEIYL